MYLCERALVPGEICTLKPPTGVELVSKDDLGRELAWRKVRNRDFGGRGHSVLDWIAGLLIVAFGAVSVFTPLRLKVITITWLGIPHVVGWLLIGNTIGLALVIGGWIWWRNRERDWPIPQPRTQGAA